LLRVGSSRLYVDDFTKPVGLEAQAILSKLVESDAKTSASWSMWVSLILHTGVQNGADIIDVDASPVFISRVYIPSTRIVTMATAYDGPDRLSKLPEEVFEMIANHALEHVLSLRQTCREAQQKSWRPFTRLFFSNRHIWIDNQSLSTMCQVASSSPHASCVKRLVVHLHEWNEHEILESWPGGSLRHTLSGSTEGMDRAFAQVNAQEYLLHSGDASLLLSCIISQLPNLETLEIAGDWEPLDVWPHSHFKDYDGDEYKGLIVDMAENDGFNAKVVLSVVQALVKTQPTLKHFHARDPLALPAQAILNLTPPVLHMLAKPFSTLETLKLGVKLPYLQPRRKYWQNSFAALLALCPQVSTLSLSFTPYVDDDHHARRFGLSASQPILESLVNWPTFSKLKVLMLEAPEIKSSALVEFLTRHYATVERLVLDSIAFGPGEDPWRLVLTSLASQDTVRHLAFSVVEHGHEHKLVRADTPSQIRESVDNALKREGPLRSRGRASSLPMYDNSDWESNDEDVYDEEFEEHFGFPHPAGLQAALFGGGPSMAYDSDDDDPYDYDSYY
jgi:hypothetical protein